VFKKTECKLGIEEKPGERLKEDPYRILRSRRIRNRAVHTHISMRHVTYLNVACYTCDLSRVVCLDERGRERKRGGERGRERERRQERVKICICERECKYVYIYVYTFFCSFYFACRKPQMHKHTHSRKYIHTHTHTQRR